jgi:hypothetical protein
LPVASSATNLQPVAQVVGEYVDRAPVRAHLELHAQIVLHAGREQALVAVVDGERELLGERAARLLAHHAGELQREHFAVHLDARAQHVLALAAPDGEEAMRGDVLQRLAEVVVLLELGGRIAQSGGLLGNQHALFAERLADPRAGIGVLGQELGHDVARAGQGGLQIGHLLVGRHEREALGMGIADRRLLQDAQRQWLEPALAGDHRARAALRLVRQVQIFQRRLGGAGEDARLEFVAELALGGDRLEDGLAALIELEQVGAALLDGADLHLVERAGGLLAVAGYEGDGGPFAEQVHHGAHAGGGQAELLRDRRHGIEGVDVGRGLVHDGVPRRRSCCVDRTRAECVARPDAGRARRSRDALPTRERERSVRWLRRCWSLRGRFGGDVGRGLAVVAGVSEHDAAHADDEQRHAEPGNPLRRIAGFVRDLGELWWRVCVTHDAAKVADLCARFKWFEGHGALAPAP